jgi:hypothetical protein
MARDPPRIDVNRGDHATGRLAGTWQLPYVRVQRQDCRRRHADNSASNSGTSFLQLADGTRASQSAPRTAWNNLN